MAFSKILKKRNKLWAKPVPQSSQMKGTGNLRNKRQVIVTKLLQKKLNKPNKIKKT